MDEQRSVPSTDAEENVAPEAEENAVPVSGNADVLPEENGQSGEQPAPERHRPFYAKIWDWLKATVPGVALCAVLAVPARDLRAVAPRLFAAAETLAKCTRPGRTILAAPRLAGRYQCLLNVVAAARLDGVPLCLLCAPLPRPG